MSMDELFTTLHSRFNTWSAPLQSFEAFHHDVWEISKASSAKEDLFRALEMRKKKRSQEMSRLWEFMAIYMTAGRSMLSDDHWVHGVRFFRTRSLDHLLAFFYQFLTEKEKEEVKVLNEELGQLNQNQGKDEKEKEEPFAGVSVDNDVDVNNNPTFSTTPRPLKRDGDQPSTIDSGSDYHPHHYGKREYDPDYNTIITPTPADDKDDDVLALPTLTPSPPTPLRKETHTATAIALSIPKEPQLQKRRQRLQLPHNNNSNNNRITKRGKRIMTRGKWKAVKPRPKLVALASTGKKGSSLITITTDNTTTTATTGTITR